MHPFTSLTLWALAACSTLLLPAGIPLTVYSTVVFLFLLCMPATRPRAKYVVWLMVPRRWIVAGPRWLVDRMDKRTTAHATTVGRCHHAVAAIPAIVSTSQLWMQYVPVSRFIRALFASRLPPGVAYLFAGPLLVVEQLKRQLAIIHEAQRARGVPLDEHWYQRLRAMPALIVPLTHNALNDLVVRGAALDMRAFRLHRRRTTLWAPEDSTLQRIARYTMVLAMLVETGVWIWLR